jgi:uncharacterized protein YbbC (DUF1343 family)
VAHRPSRDANYGVSTPIRFGVDRLVADPNLLAANRRELVARAGLVTSDAARLAADPTSTSRSALLACGVPIVRLFGPEHGLTATAADGASVGDSIDATTGLPVVSLYGANMRPTAEMLADLDVVLFDIPDVGARFYTYTWTLFHLLAACTEAAVRVVVLDRPNPLGGDLARAEGPILEASCRSFLGEDAIPVTHQLTLGELARLWQRERFPSLVLDVIGVEGWMRATRWNATGLTWVPTSPSMPWFDSAQQYPGLCLFEAINVSVGRGTDAPFQRIGAPWLDAESLMRDARTRWDIELVRDDFTPELAPYRHDHCVGVRVYADDAALPVARGLALLASMFATQRPHVAWAVYPTAANPTGAGHFDRLVGVPGLDGEFARRGSDIRLDQIARWMSTETWRARVAPVLLYD